MSPKHVDVEVEVVLNVFFMSGRKLFLIIK